MRINHNIAALNTYRQLTAGSLNASKSMEKLSSGLRINRAGDDAAGLAISEKMRGQIRGLEQASRNAQDGISLLQTAEGALNEVHSILQRMRELAVQASNDTATDADRQALQKEVEQLKSEIDRIANTTEFNTKKLLNGDLEGNKIAQGTKLESVKINQVATNGTSLAGNALQATTSIVAGANDLLKLKLTNADGTTITKEYTLAAGNYTRQGLVDQINAQIGSTSDLAGKVTAQLTNDNRIIFVTNEQAAGVKIEVQEASVSDKTALVALGFQNAPAAVSSTATLGTSAFVDGTSDSIKVTIGGKTIDNIDFLSANFTVGTDGDGNALAKLIQDAINTAFGGSASANVISVTYDSGNDKLVYSSTSGAEVNIAAATNNSATNVANLAADAVNTTLSSNGNKTETTGVAAGSVSTSTTLISLGDADGNSYGLKAGNVIRISGTLNGTAFNNNSSLLTIDSTTTVQDLLDEIAQTIPGAESVTLDSTTGQIKINGQLGEAYGIANLKIVAETSATDSTQVATFSNDFSAFKEIQAAQDAHTDSSLSFHIGANESQTMKVDINEMSVKSLALSSVDVSTQQGAETAISVINNAIEKVSTERSKLGAFQNRLEHTINNLGTSAENLTASESRIRDVDYALAA